MPATLKLPHKTIGAEVRRGTYEAVVDGKRAGTLELNQTIAIAVEPGRQRLRGHEEAARYRLPRAHLPPPAPRPRAPSPSRNHAASRSLRTRSNVRRATYCL
jgi:hypothetical protein